MPFFGPVEPSRRFGFGTGFHFVHRGLTFTSGDCADAVVRISVSRVQDPIRVAGSPRFGIGSGPDNMPQVLQPGVGTPVERRSQAPSRITVVAGRLAGGRNMRDAAMLWGRVPTRLRSLRRDKRLSKNRCAERRRQDAGHQPRFYGQFDRIASFNTRPDVQKDGRRGTRVPLRPSSQSLSNVSCLSANFVGRTGLELVRPTAPVLNRCCFRLRAAFPWRTASMIAAWQRHLMDSLPTSFA